MVMRAPADVALSVVIPTRNRPRQLRRALASLARQTRGDLDIVVVNDGSTERYDLADVFAELGVRYLATRRARGPAYARNKGIALARGRWIAFLDDDDEWESDFAATMLERLEREGDGAVFAWSGFLNLEYGADGVLREEPRLFAAQHRSTEQLFSEALSIGAGCGLTLNRACFAHAGVFRTDYTLLEDTEFLFRLLTRGCRPIAVPDVLVRIHLDNSLDRLTSVIRYPTRIAEFKRLLAEYDGFLTSYGSIRKSMWEYCQSLEDEYQSYRLTLES